MLHAAVLFLSLSMLLFEILLTRLISAEALYHFSFLALSLAMCGLSAGSAYVVSRRTIQADLPTYSLLYKGSFNYSLSLLFALPCLYVLPFSLLEFPLLGAGSLLLALSLMTLPFFLCGTVLATLFSTFKTQFASLYGFDLLGAALGAWAAVSLFEIFPDLPLLMLLAVAFGLLSAFLFWRSDKLRHIRALPVWMLSCLLVAVLFICQWRAVIQGKTLLPLVWQNGSLAEPSVLERWSILARIALLKPRPQDVTGWGMSRKTPAGFHQQKTLLIDAIASTTIEKFDGNLEALSHLAYDVSNFAHYLVNSGKVVVLGAGGARDVLSAIYFNQKEVFGIELNRNILDIVHQSLAEFSGHLTSNPRIHLVNQEARHYLRGTSQNFDVIQISMIDTWASGASGSFALSENGLYTLEAFKLFLERLNDQGVLTVSRWHNPELPGELYRAVALASAALRSRGILDVRKHLLLVSSLPADAQVVQGDGVASLLIFKDSITPQQLSQAESRAKLLDFNILLAPNISKDRVFDSVAHGDIPDVGLDLSVPTDNRPFFFNMLPFSALFDLHTPLQGYMQHNMQAGRTLALTILSVIVVGIFFLARPMRYLQANLLQLPSLRLISLFALSGFGFMLIELSFLQRLNLYLGHPALGTSIGLASCLLATGIGSLLSARFLTVTNRRAGFFMFLAWVGVLCFLSDILLATEAYSNFARGTITFLFSVLVFSPLGTVLPFALRSIDSQQWIAFLWGINGITSVLGGCFAFLISLYLGINYALLLGILSYLGVFFLSIRNTNLKAA